MKKLVLFLFAAASAVTLWGQGREWLDPKVNAVNRMPMHANFFAYESLKAAKEGDRSASERFLSLNGDWKFFWVRNVDQRPADFFKVGYDDKGWDNMPVPGLWEHNGYGDPLYVNTGYPWREQFENDPPNVPVENNHVGSYRRTVTVPDSWKGQQVIAHFGSVTSNIYLWVNGKYVGYSEDSKLEAEFDITRYVKPGENLIAFQTFRWCDGTYLEDQDFFRFAGVGRDCYLYARPEKHIADINIRASLEEYNTRGILDVKVDFSKKAKGSKLKFVLRDPKGETVISHDVAVNAAVASFKLDAGGVEIWSAETPNLYSAMVSLTDQAGSVIEAIYLKTGFRNVAIEDGFLVVNGQQVLIKGANRHEMDPDYGYIVSEERMIQDIRILKRNNFNAVRTCHYPDNNRWYELCDEYGLYLVAEANVETHGMGYGDKTLAQNPAFDVAHLERNQRNVLRSINHPSVIIWSLGNEAGDGPNFDACYDWIKSYDPSRPVHYERAIYSNPVRNTDITCPMYWDYKRCEEYAQGNPAKPLIQCEYAHAMGNSMGGFKEYWELIRKYPSFQGGFIWDFVDQSQRKKGRDGVMIYGYGGDWNPYDASDMNFCDNGLIGPDRILNPHMHEVKYHQQPVWTEAVDITTGKISVFNEYFFRDLSNYMLEWEVLCDGVAVKSGLVYDLRVEPQEYSYLTLPYLVSGLPAKGELLLNVSYKLKTPEPLIPNRYAIAEQQLVIREAAAAELTVENKSIDRHTTLGSVNIVDNDKNFLIVEGGRVRIDFNRRTGYMTRYDVGGESYLRQGSSLRPNFWRAPTDNDFGADLQRKNRVWKNPKIDLTGLTAELRDGIVVVMAVYDLPSIPAKLSLEYKINNAGEVVVKQSMHAAADVSVPGLMRFGMRMEMPAEYDRVNYYGRGPWENYSDRKDASFIGIFSQTVGEQFYPYIRPQEMGTKSDLRWWHQSNLGGRGLEFISSEPFSASALHYSQESLDEGLEKRQGHSQEVEKQQDVFLCIDKVQQGLGCVNSWGALPRPEYMLPYGDYTFEFKMSPRTKLY